MPCVDNKNLIYNIKELPETFSIASGDLLLVDKSLKPKNFSTVIANVHDELVVKSFIKKKSLQFLSSGSQNFEDRIIINEDSNVFCNSSTG